MAASQVQVDIKTNKDLDLSGDPEGFRWVLQTTKPIRNEAVSAQSWPTRADAIRSFEAMAERMGWILHSEETS